MRGKTTLVFVLAVALAAATTGTTAPPAQAAPPLCGLAVSNPVAFRGKVYGSAIIVCNRPVQAIHVWAFLTKNGRPKGDIARKTCLARDRCGTVAKARKTEGLWHTWGDGVVVYREEGERRRKRFRLTRSPRCIYISVR